MTTTATANHAPDEAPVLADHLALDLLNTEARDDGAAIDFWHSGDDVRRWLDRQGVVAPKGAKAADGAALLAQATALRTLARELVTRRKAGKTADPGPLNAFLATHVSAPQLVHDGDGKLVLVRVPRGDAIASMLGPVAEAVAQLLADGDFALVRQCEHPDCVLWFYDRTKAHKRRWCSMALCGNRHKAARFRQRSAGE